MRRLRKRWIAGLLLGLLAAPFVRWGLADRHAPEARSRPTRVSAALQIGGTRVAVHAIPTGTISIKSCHQHACLPDLAPPTLRMLPIVFGTTFEAPMPIWSYVIEHPEGAIAVDTGELRRFAKDPNYGACDPGANWVFHEILAVDVRDGEEQAEQLAAMGLTPPRFLAVVITHQHPDHIGGVGAFQGTPIYMSRVDASLGGRAGQATCRNLEGANQRPHEDLTKPGFDADADAAFGASFPLTRDGRVLLVPTPGHTPGSVSLLVKGDTRDALFIGDVSFTEEALDGHDIAGIHISMQDARSTQARVRAYSARRPTVVLPAHDANVPARLAQLAPPR